MKIKLVLITLSFLLISLFYIQSADAGGRVSVKGYTRKDGTYVSPHYRTAPDGNFYNNWSTKGNVNPYTGKEGTLSYPNNSTGSSFVLPSTTTGTINESSPLNEKSNAIPKNAKVNYFGNGWECEFGYRQSGNSCLAVELPKHAKINYFGNGWECEFGYRQSGNSCLAVELPQHAKINYFGNGWECEYGYRQSANSCVSN